MAPGELPRFLFGLRERVTPRAYAAWGFGLLALKYAVDWGLSARFAEHALLPLSYLNPILTLRLADLGQHPDWLLAVMAGWGLPFIWIGVAMTARRLVDAGKTPWACLLFFVPVVNYLLMLGLCVAPSADAQRGAAPLESEGGPQLRVAMRALFVTLCFAMLAVPFAVFWATAYGTALFIGVPFLIGVISGALYNRQQAQSGSATMKVALLALLLTGGVLLLFALEGLLCLAMASLLAIPLTVLGSLVGRAWADSTRVTSVMALAWPLLACLPGDGPDQFRARAVVSSIEIDAPPERVWPNVIGFAELPPPSEWLLKTGIACPLRAHIEGEGVGAVRYCEFSTGPFVEPITAWEPPYRLAFSVARQPPSMREWSPYEIVHAPHVVGSLQSQRGEFLITRLPGGRSRLQGTTWYRLKMSPSAYWSLYADAVIHVIHLRVLRHVRTLSQAR